MVIGHVGIGLARMRVAVVLIHMMCGAYLTAITDCS